MKYTLPNTRRRLIILSIAGGLVLAALGLSGCSSSSTHSSGAMASSVSDKGEFNMRPCTYEYKE